MEISVTEVFNYPTNKNLVWVGGKFRHGKLFDISCEKQEASEEKLASMKQIVSEHLEKCDHA